MTLINTVLIRYTVRGPARHAGKRGTASGPPKFVINVKFSIRLFMAGEERKPKNVIEN